MPTYDLTATQKSYRPKPVENYKVPIENLEIRMNSIEQSLNLILQKLNKNNKGENNNG